MRNFVVRNEMKRCGRLNDSFTLIHMKNEQSDSYQYFFMFISFFLGFFNSPKNAVSELNVVHLQSEIYLTNYDMKIDTIFAQENI